MYVEKSPTNEDLFTEKAQPEMEEVLVQSTKASNQLVLPAENPEYSMVPTEESQKEVTEQNLEPTFGTFAITIEC